MAKPKLILIPSNQGSKINTVLPTDGSGDFDFSRASKATVINEYGLIESVDDGVSRLNYPLIDGVVSGCPSLLLEPSRTNLLTYSSGFVTDWNNTNITINSNSIISPDGTLNATKFIPNNTSSQHYLDRNSIVVNSNASASVFAKKGEHQRFAINSYFTGANAVFDLGIGSVLSSSSVTAKIEDYGNGWYRCSLNETLNVNYGYGIFVMQNDSLSKSDSYSGNGIDGMYFYGAQLEIGSFISSYIPTTTAAVTRAAETATGSGDASTFNDSEGVLMAEISALANDLTNRTIGVLGDSNNLIEIAYRNTSNQVRCLIKSSGVVEVNIQHILSDITLNNKLAVKYKSNNTSLYVNGFEVATGLSANMPSGLNKLNFNRFDGAEDFYGNTKQLQYYNSALTDSELEILTSWASFTEMAIAQLYTIE